MTRFLGKGRSALVKLIIMKRGGEPGEVAINPELVTHVRSTSGPFTDIFFGEHRVVVDGTFRQVVEKLSGPGGTGTETQQGATRTWISAAP